jgi:hypothetical protein
MAQFIPHGAISGSEIGFDLFIFKPNPDKPEQKPGTAMARRSPGSLKLKAGV